MMAAYDLEEQEQLANLKAWWARYGNIVSSGVMIFAFGLLAVQGWNWYQRKQSTGAASIYGALQRAIAQSDMQKVREASGEILSKYPNTAYADLAALLTAAKQIESKDEKSARSKLEWVANNADDQALRDLARLRLAALQGEEKSYDQALKTLDVKPTPALLPRFADLRGDLLFALGKKDEAKAAYKEALDALGNEAESPLKGVLKTKYEALGGSL